ncbi:YdcF family protein [Yoonia sp. 2307UL14-13]|uniref:YdcF family protein n=1 Tax=Yoonia sp. 2307UL14-13 TaxID=3126506 RepID=UPI0030A46832
MDAILILGAAVWADGPSPTLRRRTLHAAKLWHQGVAPLIVPCGGLGAHPPTEAAVMRDILLQAKVADRAVLLEDRSTSTLENIRFARRLLSGPVVTIVTDKYHERRALMVARHFGLKASASCPPQTGSTARHRLREAFARPAYTVQLMRISRDDRSA